MGLVADQLPSRYPGDARFRLVLATDVALVSDAVEAVLGCCELGAPLSVRDRFRLSTVTAEAITNAMLYGNRDQPGRRVTVEVELGPVSIGLAVTDEGPGFDPSRIPELVAEAECHSATRGRGLAIIRHLAELVRFNPEGNAIWVTFTRT